MRDNNLSHHQNVQREQQQQVPFYFWYNIGSAGSLLFDNIESLSMLEGHRKFAQLLVLATIIKETNQSSEEHLSDFSHVVHVKSWAIRDHYNVVFHPMGSSKSYSCVFFHDRKQQTDVSSAHFEHKSQDYGDFLHDKESLNMMTNYPKFIQLMICAIRLREKNKHVSSEENLSDATHVVHVKSCGIEDRYDVDFHFTAFPKLYSCVFFPHRRQQTDSSIAPNQQLQKPDHQDQKREQPRMQQ